MVNPIRGQAICELGDGTTLTLVVDFEALAIAEEVADKGVNDLLAEMGGEPRMKTMRAIIYGALRERHPDLDLQSVGSILLSPADGTIVSQALGRAIAGAFSETGGAQNPPAPSSGAGTASSKTGRRKV